MLRVSVCSSYRPTIDQMLPNKKRPWTTEDDEKLMALAAARRSTISIAAAMKRSKGAVLSRLSALRQRTSVAIGPRETGE